ncbi:hypothetical protein QA601_05435 [Chitinispirillales bacterium ANBcel5]|uniref:hypothetical protein n=1 Tax=Cellulosispirillum alkaliphilum TaxID=3039283 RepID=UPI002A4EBA40|nr:hypothetical protein [Chitinispirillales bacterium ANBcel5]
MVKVLVADDDLDSHELLSDILQINFQDVQVDRALNSSSFVAKVMESQTQYDLILFSVDIDEEPQKIVQQIQSQFPDILNRTVLMVGADQSSLNSELLQKLPRVSKPFSLDHFAEIIRKICVE